MATAERAPWAVSGGAISGGRTRAACLCLLASSFFVGCQRAPAAGDAEPLAEQRAALLTGSAALYEEQIETYASLSSNGADWGPAFQQFLTSSDAHVLRLSCDKVYPVGTTFNALGACTADGTQIPAAVNICREVTIVGCGKSTVIESAPGISAFAVRFNAWCGTTGGAHGGRTKLKDLVIKESSASASVRYGVFMQTSAALEDVQISGFSNGVKIDGNVNATSCLAKSGANMWKLHRVQVSGAEHAGILARNGDANVGLGRSIHASGNCTAPTKTSGAGTPLYSGVAWPACAGVIDDSFLGSTWTAIYSHDNSGRTATRLGNDSPNVCVGCYSSGGTGDGSAEVIAGDNSLVLGGKSTFAGGVVLSRRVLTGAALIGPTFAPVDLPGDNDPLLHLRLQDGSLMHIQQDETNASGMRGAWNGSSSHVAWRWFGSPPSFTGYP